MLSLKHKPSPQPDRVPKVGMPGWTLEAWAAECERMAKCCIHADRAAELRQMALDAMAAAGVKARSVTLPPVSGWIVKAARGEVRSSFFNRPEKPGSRDVLW